MRVELWRVLRLALSDSNLKPLGPDRVVKVYVTRVPIGQLWMIHL